MAGNVLGTSLPRATSQARVFSPVSGATNRNSALQDILQAAPGIANSFIRAQDLQQRETARNELNTQKAEDAGAIAGALTDRNNVLLQRDEAASAENNLQSLALSWSQATADGDISEQDNQILTNLQSAFTKTKTAQAQGLLNNSQTGTRLRIAQNAFIAENPHLAAQADKLFSIDKNAGGSTVTGAAAKQQLQFNQRMEFKYGQEYTLDNVIAERSKMAASESLKRSSEIGKHTFEGIAETTTVATNLGIDDLMQKVGTAYSVKQGLTFDEESQFVAQAEQLRRNLVSDLTKGAAELRAAGIGTVDATVRNAAITNLNSQFDAVIGRIQDKSLLKTFVQRNKFSDELYKAEIGSKMSRLNIALDKAGDGVQQAVGATILNNDPAQQRILTQLAGEAGADSAFLQGAKSIIIDAAERAVNPTPPPGFEKMDAYFGISSVQRGPVAPVVFKNSLRAMTKLVNSPKDAAVNIDTVNDPKYSVNASKQGAEELNEFKFTVNGWEAHITNPMKDGGYSVIQDPQTGSLIVSRPQVIAANEGVFGVPLDIDIVGPGVTRVVINRGLSQQLNKARALHNNADYIGILQPNNEWLQDILLRFKPQSTQPQ